MKPTTIAKKKNKKVSELFASLKYGFMSATASCLSAVGIGFCDINANSSMQNFLKKLFSVLVFAGIVLAVAGVVSLLRTIVSMASGEQAQPGALGKGIGLLLGGIFLATAKALLQAILGVDPTTLTFL